MPKKFAQLLAVALTLTFPITNISRATTPDSNLAQNPNFQQKSPDPKFPANFTLIGDATYRYLGDPLRDAAPWGVALNSAHDLNHNDTKSGQVSQLIPNLDPKSNRWYRFSFRGLAQDGFSVANQNLYMKVEYLGADGKTTYDGKIKKIYPLVELDRRNMTVNGDRHINGAAVWRTYELDFMLPFAQIQQVRASVGFSDGASTQPNNSQFFITDYRLMPITEPELMSSASTRPDSVEKRPDGLLPLGGRWFYLPKPGETIAPKDFDYKNADRLIYHDTRYSAPFAYSMSSWLRIGDKDLQGNVVLVDQFIPDNVTVSFTPTELIIHTHGLPNHPTGKFPEFGSGPQSNPNFIQEKTKTYFLPLDPSVNPNHIATARDNSNHALPMGPIGIACNGVVFFNPFDANSQDASNMMDRCCGHPAPDNTYHYHKYPICINSPWSDDGADHSPIIGFAFDGFPIYGPYEKQNVMAKDVTGSGALNNFNIHFDPDRGWHYHVTPGQFPYIIGGFYGTEDPKDHQRGRPGMNGGGMNGGGPGGPGGGMGGPNGGPGGPNGRRPPPPDGGPPPDFDGPPPGDFDGPPPGGPPQ